MRALCSFVHTLGRALSPHTHTHTFVQFWLSLSRAINDYLPCRVSSVFYFPVAVFVVAFSPHHPPTHTHTHTHNTHTHTHNTHTYISTQFWLSLSRAINDYLPCRVSSVCYFPVAVFVVAFFKHRLWSLYVRHYKADLLLTHAITRAPGGEDDDEMYACFSWSRSGLSVCLSLSLCVSRSLSLSLSLRDG